MNIRFSNKFLASDKDGKNEVLVIKDTEICHVGMNGNFLIFEKDELEKAFKTLEKVPLVANVTDYTDDHNTSALNTVGWVYEPEMRGGTIFATLEVTHPEIIEKIKRKTTKGEREINFVSMGCHAEKIHCSICGEEIVFDTMFCDKGHQVGEKYEGQVCGMIGKNIEFEHVALTNVPADKSAKLGKEVVMMVAKKKLIAEEEKKIPQEEEKPLKAEEKTTEEKVEESEGTPAEEVIKASDDKLIEALKDKINVLESEVEEIRESIKAEKEKEDENMVEKETIPPINEEEEKITSQDENIEKKKEMEAEETGEEPIVAEEEEEKEKTMEARAINMYKKLIAKSVGELPKIVAKSKSLSFVRAYYKAKARNQNRFMAGRNIMAAKRDEQIELKAAMEDRTGAGYKKLFAYAKKNKRM